MTRSALAGAAVALVAGGMALGWFASRRPEVGPSTDDRSAEIASLRTAADAQAAKIASLASRPDPSAETARLLAALREQSARIERLERAPPPPDAAAADVGTKAVLENLKAVTDGGRTVALQDALAALVHAGDAAVPDIVALLRSGFDREYGGGLVMKGNAVQSYPNLRLVLMDALRQIGTPAAKDALLATLEQSDRPTDCPVVWMFWDGGLKDTSEPPIVAALSAMTSASLKKVAATGLDAAGCDVQNGPGVSILFWILRHPVAEDAPALEQLVMRGRPKDGEASELFAKFFDALVEVAPEKAAVAAHAMQRSEPEKWVVFGLSQSLGDASRSSQARYFTALFSQGDVDVRQRCELYQDYVPHWLDERIADPTQRVADAQRFVRLLESRVNAETDAEAKACAERALNQLREAIEKAQK